MSLSEEQMKIWTDLIDWLTEQDDFVIIGTKEGVVNARSSVELVEAKDMVELVYHMISNVMEGRDESGLTTLQ